MHVHPLSGLLLRFERDAPDPNQLRQQLSACALDPDGNLWLGTDEGTGLSRLTPQDSSTFGGHLYIDLAGRLDLPDPGEEIDVEGLDIEEDRLWIIGSHTSTRKNIQPDKGTRDNLKRLGKVRLRPNRFLIARAHIQDGTLRDGRIAQLPISKDGNALSRALRGDPHLGRFMCAGNEGDGVCVPLASKENGFDIEGVAARGPRLFIGLRGPVLRGWAMLLEIQLREDGDGRFDLEEIGEKWRPYRKHLVDLDGMGVRDLSWDGDDLLILAGPTMDISGLQSLYRLRGAIQFDSDTITEQDDQRLQRVLHLPFAATGDKAEGICRYDGTSGAPRLLVVYDSPRQERLVSSDGVMSDVFALPEK